MDVFRNLSRKFDGAYNLVFLNAMGDMVVLRDPVGIRPLVYAQDGPMFGAASESVALQNLGFRQAMEELEGILGRIEGEAIDIDQLAQELRRAAQLLELCRGKIRKAEVEVTQIVQTLEAADRDESAS